MKYTFVTIAALFAGVLAAPAPAANDQQLKSALEILHNNKAEIGLSQDEAKAFDKFMDTMQKRADKPMGGMPPPGGAPPAGGAPAGGAAPGGAAPGGPLGGVGDALGGVLGGGDKKKGGLLGGVLVPGIL